MTQQWRMHDKAMIEVEVVGFDGNQQARIRTCGRECSQFAWLPLAALKSLPSTPLAAANARVAEAAERWWMETSNEIGPDGKTGYSAMHDALADRRALLAPPVPVDPVVELVRMVKAAMAGGALPSIHAPEFGRAIAAVEAARKAGS